MGHKYSRLIPMAVLVALGATSCSASTSPATRALDGAWTTGHACLTLGLNLDWTDAAVRGSGTYRTASGPEGCAALPMLGDLGGVVLEAHRNSSTSISGTMTFDNTTRAAFTGTLATTGGARINALVVTPDDRATTVTLFEGLIP